MTEPHAFLNYEAVGWGRPSVTVHPEIPGGPGAAERLSRFTELQGERRVLARGHVQ